MSVFRNLGDRAFNYGDRYGNEHFKLVLKDKKFRLVIYRSYRFFYKKNKLINLNFSSNSEYVGDDTYDIYEICKNNNVIEAKKMLDSYIKFYNRLIKERTDILGVFNERRLDRKEGTRRDHMHIDQELMELLSSKEYYNRIQYRKLCRYLYLNDIRIYRSIENESLLGHISFNRFLYSNRSAGRFSTNTKKKMMDKKLSKNGKMCTIGKFLKKAKCSDEYIRKISDGFKPKVYPDPSISNKIEDIKSIYLRSDTSCASCMSHDYAQPYLESFKNYPVSICWLEEEDVVISRALLWELNNGQKYLDRIYYTQDKARISMLIWAKKNNYLRHEFDREMKGLSVTPTNEINPREWQWPYMDTFLFQNKEGIFFNNSYDGSTLRKIRDQYGGPYISRNRCNHCGKNVSSDEYMEARGHYYCNAECVSNYGLRYCTRCGCYESKDGFIEAHDYRGNTINICSMCASDFILCKDCGIYFDKEYMHKVNSKKVCHLCKNNNYDFCFECNKYYKKAKGSCKCKRVKDIKSIKTCKKKEQLNEIDSNEDSATIEKNEGLSDTELEKFREYANYIFSQTDNEVIQEAQEVVTPQHTNIQYTYSPTRQEPTILSEAQLESFRRAYSELINVPIRRIALDEFARNIEIERDFGIGVDIDLEQTPQIEVNTNNIEQGDTNA